MIKYLILGFTIFVLVYIVYLYTKLNYKDIIIFIISLGVLLYLLFSKKKIEHFSDIYTPDLIDDLSIIRPIAVSYISVYTPNCYNPATGNFKDIINSENEYTFTKPPTNVSNPQVTGIPMNSSIITGPKIDTLNFQFESQYSILYVCKFGNFVIPNTNRVELFRFNANCSTNVGISIYIDVNSLTQYGPLFAGDLKLQYTDTTPDTPCVLVEYNKSMFIFDPSKLTYFFVTRNSDTISISYITDTMTTTNILANITVTNNGTTFANVPISLNYLSNLTGNLYTFGIFNVSLTDIQITQIYRNINNLYKLYNSGADQYWTQYTELQNTHNKLGSCPFDNNTCQKCGTIDNWTDVSQIINTTSDCKKYINDACAANPQNASLCMCWNSASSIYNTSSCKLYRSIFTSPDDFLRNLSTDNLNIIRDQYGMLLASECPKDIRPLESNSMCFDSDYTYDKIKLNYSLSNSETEYVPPGSTTPIALSKKDYDIQVQAAKDIIISPSQFKNTSVIQENNITATVMNSTNRVYTPSDIQQLAKTYNNNINQQPFYENNNTNILQTIKSWF